MEMQMETGDGIMEAKPRAEKGGSGKGGRAVDQALAEAAAKAIWSGPLLVKAAVALTQGKGRAVAGSKASAFRSFEPWNEFHRIFLELRVEIEVWILLPLLNSWLTGRRKMAVRPHFTDMVAAQRSANENEEMEDICGPPKKKVCWGER